MYALCIIRYRKPLEEVAANTEDHRNYLRTLREKGVLVASGPFSPRLGGALLVRVSDENTNADLDAIRDNDPFVQRGLAQYEMQGWNLTFGKEGLDKL
jgi:uncharacterized protein YciI